MHYLCLRCNRISEIITAACAKSSFCDYFVTFHQYFLVSHSSKTLPFNSDYGIGALNCTESTADAGSRIRADSGMITLIVKSALNEFKDLLGAGIDTKTAAFAKIVSERYFCHIHFPFSLITHVF